MEYLDQINNILTDSQRLIEDVLLFVNNDHQFSMSYDEDELNKYSSFIKVYDVVQYNMTALYNYSSKLKIVRARLKQAIDVVSSLPIGAVSIRDLKNKLAAQVHNIDEYVDIVQTHLDKYQVQTRFLNVINYNK